MTHADFWTDTSCYSHFEPITIGRAQKKRRLLCPVPPNDHGNSARKAIIFDIRNLSGFTSYAAFSELAKHEFSIDVKVPEIPGGRLMRIEHFLQRSDVLDPTGAGLAARI